MARPNRPTTVKTPKSKAAKPPMSPLKAQLIAAAIAVGFIALVVTIIITSNQARPVPDALPTVAPSDAGQLVRDDSHVITEATPDSAEVVLVEFLDLQCPACASSAPLVDELAARYGDRLAIVQRHLPLTSIHRHAIDAAVAAEAAGQQGAWHDMATALFQSQSSWSASTTSQADTFRALAEELGLDMAAYDAAVADPATRERVALDAADAAALGLASTPSFILDGEVLQLSSFDELVVAVEAALS